MDESEVKTLIADKLEGLVVFSRGGCERVAATIYDAISERCIILNRKPYDLFGNGIPTVEPIYAEASTGKRTFQEIVAEN